MNVGAFGQGQFDDGVFFFFAQQQADGGIFLGQLHVAVVVVHVHLHLTKILMGELVQLQVDDDVTAQEPIIKHQIKEVVIAVEGKTLLPCFEQETLAEFE